MSAWLRRCALAEIVIVLGLGDKMVGVRYATAGTVETVLSIKRSTQVMGKGVETDEEERNRHSGAMSQVGPALGHH